MDNFDLSCYRCLNLLVGCQIITDFILEFVSACLIPWQQYLERTEL